LSYQPNTFAVVPFAMVSPLSKMHEYGDWLMSVDTSGAVEYWRYPSSGPAAAARYASLIASVVACCESSTVRSVTEPVGIGARTATPSSLPLSSGRTSPIARAAPVEVGTRLSAAARARRRSLCGPSWRLWSCVYAWIVVMNPRSTPNASFRTFASGPRQFVVQDALEMMWCASGS
jgi:hypothetical protein